DTRWDADPRQAPRARPSHGAVRATPLDPGPAAPPRRSGYPDGADTGPGDWADQGFGPDTGHGFFADDDRRGRAGSPDIRRSPRRADLHAPGGDAPPQSTPDATERKSRLSRRGRKDQAARDGQDQRRPSAEDHAGPGFAPDAAAAA